MGRRIMKTRTALLALLLAACVSRPALAQVPNIQVYSDPSFTNPFIGCLGGNGTVLHPLYVVLNNWSEPFSAVDFSISFAAGMAWVTDILPDPTGSVLIGQSPTGVAVAWGGCCLPDPTVGQVLLLMPQVVAFGEDCCEGFPNPYVQVRGYMNKQNPTVVRYPDFTEFPVLGLTSILCEPPVATESTTWGGIKALYR